MADKTNYRWNVDLASITDPKFAKMKGEYDQSLAQMRQRTSNFELYGLIAKNKSIHEWAAGKPSGKYFSEGSSQYILRKSLANTIQRVPDGELVTQYDKNSVEQIILEYIFNNKVLWSEFEGIDMLSNITDTFKFGFTYGFAPVRIGFEKDFDDDARISYNLESWSDVAFDLDCKDIRRPQTLWHRGYISRASVEALLDEDGNVRDKTYREDTVRYVLDHEMFGAKQAESEKLGDKLKGSTGINSLELLTKYERGAKEFVTYVPAIGAEFRRVKNEDPRLGIPWNIFVLETDPDFPLGLSQVEFLLADQQFQDLFQTSAYKNLLLAMEPPIMVAGWETNPSSYRFEPRKIWNLGNNPNQAKVEPVRIDNGVLSSFLQTREGVAAGMLRQLNIMDGTVAKDSHVPGFSATPQGVEAQNRTKEISVNQYQKRIEYFMADWANQALRMYINSMGGTHTFTVDEQTRRRLVDVGRQDMIVGNKIEVDFDELGTDLLEFKVRTGSLTEMKEDQERKALTEVMQPLIQNLNGWSEDNRKVIENEILMPATKRLLELSDTDLANTLAMSLTNHMAKMMMAEIQGQLDGQQQQLDGIAGALPPESQAQLAQGQMEQPVAPGEGVPAPANLPAGAGMEGTSPSLPSMPLPPEPGGDVTAGQEPATNPLDLLEM